MARRPQYSRWRRLPGVFRFGDKARPNPNLDPQRLTLYLTWEQLDAAEALAARSGGGSIQDYCTRLLERAIEAERIREQVANIEAQRGPLEGLHEIAADPEYLAEWSAQIQAKARGRREPIRLDTPADLSGRASPRPAPDASPAPAEDGSPPAFESVNTSVEPAAAPSTAAVVVLRHALLASDEGPALLATLRRGASATVDEVAELARALHDLEKESRDAIVMDRRLVYALHRLAFEAQVLHTDAWPGAFDEWTVDTIRAVQESVDRILSGQDIRYYAPGPRPEDPH